MREPVKEITVVDIVDHNMADGDAYATVYALAPEDAVEKAIHEYEKERAEDESLYEYLTRRFQTITPPTISVEVIDDEPRIY